MTVPAYRDLHVSGPVQQNPAGARHELGRRGITSVLESMLPRIMQGLVARSRLLDRVDPPLPPPPPQVAEECAPAELPGELQARLPLPELSPDERVARIVRTIEADIIPRLVRNHRTADPSPAASATVAVPPTEAEVDHFVEQVLQDDVSAFSDLVRTLRGRGVTVEQIYLDLLTPAARLLGRMWEADRIMFSDVTVAVGQLQRIMRQLSPAFGDDVQHPSDGRRVLLMPAPGEQHTFGLTIVAEFFRRDGWQVIGGAGDSTLDPVALVRAEWFDVLGISCGGHGRLDWLRTGIAAVREASRNQAIGVMVGGPIFIDSPGLALDVGADATASDGRRAPCVAEELLASRSRRLPS